ncbi:MAG: signal recognition particle-docking protein FtsY [Gammaproteobacteria bacterium]|nr:signal recognition particle-docking protein FtsY [Gammaproteobacteria bacterium]
MLSFLKSNKNKETKEDGFLASVSKGLKKTRDSFSRGLGTIVLGKKVIDQVLLEEIETQLILADIGVDVTQAIITDLTRKISRKELADAEALYGALKQDLLEILTPKNQKKFLEVTVKPAVILVIGVNGSGKTTSIGKLAHLFQKQNTKIMLAAGDTFRAAAIEQLQVWGQRNNIPVIAQHSGADSASVIYDALQAAKARDFDLLIADTAGRLHTQNHLMEELIKIKRVLGKIETTAPHEILLVLDATTGQNALRQAEQFNKAMGVTGIIITKLDGTAKGGIVFAIAQKTQLPIHFIGVGEQVEDLIPFDPKEFVDALFS